jgi:hypothetical protein
VLGVGIFEFEVEDGQAAERLFAAACGRAADPLLRAAARVNRENVVAGFPFLDPSRELPDTVGIYAEPACLTLLEYPGGGAAAGAAAGGAGGAVAAVAVMPTPGAEGELRPLMRWAWDQVSWL